MKQKFYKLISSILVAVTLLTMFPFASISANAAALKGEMSSLNVGITWNTNFNFKYTSAKTGKEVSFIRNKGQTPFNVHYFAKNGETLDRKITAEAKAYICMKYSNRQISHYRDYPLLLQKFLNYIGAIANRTVDTVQSYAYDLEFFLKYIVALQSEEKSTNIENIDISNLDEEFFKKITREDILEYLFFLQSTRHNSPATRSRRLVAIRSFFDYLMVQEKVVDTNVAHTIDSPKKAKTLPKYLSYEECIQLLSGFKSRYYERDYCIRFLPYLNKGACYYETNQRQSYI